MKFNIEIELDFIDEDSCINDEIKNQIINELTKELASKISKSDVELLRLSAESVNQQINSQVNQLFEGFMEKPLTISTGWNSLNTYESVYQYIEKTFTNIINDGQKDNSIFSKYLDSKIKYYGEDLIRKFKDKINLEAKTVATEMFNANETIKSLQNLLDAAQNK